MTKKRKVTLISHYGIINNVTLLADERGYVSYRQACNAAANGAGDYYPGLEIDGYNKTARIIN